MFLRLIEQRARGEFEKAHINQMVAYHKGDQFFRVMWCLADLVAFLDALTYRLVSLKKSECFHASRNGIAAH
jgi:hypothetical protein